MVLWAVGVGVEDGQAQGHGEDGSVAQMTGLADAEARFGAKQTREC